MKRTNVVVVFERASCWQQLPVALYQLILGYKYWQAVHSFLYVKGEDSRWFKVELGWDGLAITPQEPTVDELTLDFVEFTPKIHRNVVDKLSVLVDIGEHARFSPWQCVPLILGKPVWFNCTSMVTWLLSGEFIDLPAEFMELVHD